MEEQIKQFRIQYVECHDAGMHGKGEFLRWADHPELLPYAWSRAARAINEELKVNPNAGLQTVSCERFGGTCSSSHPECRKLRGYAEKMGV